MNRRTLLAIPALAAAVSPAAAAAAHQRPRRPHRIIATEEGFALPETLAATGAYLAQNPSAEPGFRALRASFGQAQAQRWFAELVDLGEVREGVMRDAGITTQPLLHNAPGVQIFDAPEATGLGRWSTTAWPISPVPSRRATRRSRPSHRRTRPRRRTSSNDRCGAWGCTVR